MGEKRSLSRSRSPCYQRHEQQKIPIGPNNRQSPDLAAHEHVCLAFSLPAVRALHEPANQDQERRIDPALGGRSVTYEEMCRSLIGKLPTYARTAEGARDPAEDPLRERWLTLQPDNPMDASETDLSFEIQVVGAASGDELCLVSALPLWTVLSLKASIAKHTGIHKRDQCLLVQNDVLDDHANLTDLETANRRLVVSLVRVDTHGARCEQLREWLTGLHGVTNYRMLAYFDNLEEEFDADLVQIAATWKGRHRGGGVFAVDPSFWEALEVQRLGHKLILARGIAKLDANMPEVRSRQLREWLEGLDGGKGRMLVYHDILRQKFGDDLLKIKAVRVVRGERDGILGAVSPSFWKATNIQKVGHKALFAQGIVKLDDMFVER